MKYTQEQQEAIDLAGQGQTMKVSALAGTGKTSTLVGIAQAAAGRGLYLAFNKGIATEAQQRFHGTRCQARTFHSLAFATHGKNYKVRLGIRLNGLTIRKEFNLWGDDGVGVAAEALDTVSRFLRTVDDCPGEQHYRHMADEEKRDPDHVERYERIKAHALPIAHKLYDLMAARHGTFPTSHDVYLQLFVKSDPDLSRECDYLLFDEAQDADRLMLHLCSRQRIPVIYVGDQYQQIYGWRGAQNAMARIQAPETFLTQSFRFGAEIAAMANQVLATLGAPRPLLGLPDMASTCQIGGGDGNTPARAFIARTNAAVMEAVLAGLGRNKRIGVAGKNGILQMLNDFLSLRDGQPKGQFALFATEQDLRDYAQEESGKDLATFLRLVDRHGAPNLDRAIRACVDLDQDKAAWARCDLVAVTGHKAKGLEFDSVRLAEDFFQPKRLRSVNPETGADRINMEELRLIYVAMTRARRELYLPEIDPKDDIFGWFYPAETKPDPVGKPAPVSVTNAATPASTSEKKPRQPRRAAKWEADHKEAVREQTAERVRRHREKGLCAN